MRRPILRAAVGTLGPAIAVAMAACGPGQPAATGGGSVTPANPTALVTETFTAAPINVADQPQQPSTAQPVLASLPECRTAKCGTVFTLAVAGGATLAAVRVDTPDGNTEGLIAYWHNGKLLDHRGLSAQRPEPDDLPIAGHCDRPVAAGQRCLIGYATGAHSAAALAVLLRPTGPITVTSSVRGDAPDTHLADFNGDGSVDVALRISTYQPSYANGPQFWETWVDRDGTLVSTGCGTPSSTPTPAPSTPLTGSCAH